MKIKNRYELEKFLVENLKEGLAPLYDEENPEEGYIFDYFIEEVERELDKKDIAEGDDVWWEMPRWMSCDGNSHIFDVEV